MNLNIKYKIVHDKCKKLYLTLNYGETPHLIIKYIIISKQD